MLRFKIDGVPYEVPDYTPINVYAKIYKIKDLFTDEYFAAKLISAISDCPLQDLLDCPFEEISYISNYILNNLPKEKDVKFVDRFELDGVKYGFIPDWKDISFAEFADLDTLSTKKQDEILDVLHIIASIMYRPIIEEKKNGDFRIEKYNVDSMKERAELFKRKLNIKYLLGAQFFFINFANKFSNYSQLSLMQNLSTWERIKLIWLMRKWLVMRTFSKKPMDGLQSSTELLKTILQNTKLYTKKN